MPRNMSFSLTTRQIRHRMKTVTRRLGWKFLRPGDIVNACVKCRGLRPGQKVERICQIRIVDVREEPLSMLCHSSYTVYGQAECRREGFPDMHPGEFVLKFCASMGCQPDDTINRIEFEYLP